MVDPADPRWFAALQALDQAGAELAEPEVVRDGLSLLVRGGDTLVRVRRRDQEPVAAREVEVALALAVAEVPVTPLVPGLRQPLLTDRWVVTAWRWIDARRPAVPEDLGSLARLLREHTVGTYVYDVARFDPLAAVRSAVAKVPIGDEQGDFVRKRAQELSSRWAQVADRDPAGTAIVHGDLHGDNVVVGERGPMLTDLEWAGAGPTSYDTAPSVVMVERYGQDPATLEAFVAAQGHDPRSWPGFRTCVDVYELWVTAWAVGVRDRSEQHAQEAATRVDCLRDDTCEPWHLL